MSKQTIEIEVPDGWRVVGYRAPKEGEYYLDDLSRETPIYAGSDFASMRLIVERDPDYIEAIEVRLKPGWIAMDAKGGVYWFEQKPLRCATIWHSPHNFLRVDEMVSIDLGTDWTKSLRRVSDPVR